MKSASDSLRHLAVIVGALGLLGVAAPAAAQWDPVAGVAASRVFSVWANGDTIAAGADTAVYVSTNAGAAWSRSSKPVAGVVAIEAVRIRNGRLYAGTFGQGAFVSDDLGASWSAFNQGLVGGFLDSQLDITDFELRGDSLYAATAGAGVYVRGLTGATTWHHFGEVFEPNQDSNVNAVVLGGIRLLAMAGGNGQVYIRDPGDAEWTQSHLDNVGIHAGLAAQSGAWTGTGWVVGSNLGVFLSALGEEPWTRLDLGFGPLDWTAFALQHRHLFAAFSIAPGAVIEDSGDDGASWQFDEFLPSAFVFHLAISGDNLYAARNDGLWVRTTHVAAAPSGGETKSLRFSLVGPQPCRDQARVRFVLPHAGSASIELFDMLGRRAGERISGTWSAGPHEVLLDARRLNPGVYAALLTADGAHEVLRLVRVR